jgi:hypothetical protein
LGAFGSISADDGNAQRFFEKNITEKIAEKTLSHFLSVSFSLFSILCTLALAVNVSGGSLA